MGELSGAESVPLVVADPQPLRILFFDIETAPMRAYIWSPKQDYIPHNQVISDSFMLCWAAKWNDGSKVMSAKLTPEEVAEADDSRIAAALADLVREADLVCAHNGDRFDVPRLNARLLMNGLEPVPPVESLDTLKLAKKSIGVAHYNLDALARALGLGTKIKTDFDLWLKVLEGSEVAMQHMTRYCRNDVVLLEKVFERLRPYARGLRRLTGGGEGAFCPYCGSREFERRGTRHNSAGSQQRFHCLNDECGRYFHHKTSDAGKREMRPTP